MAAQLSPKLSNCGAKKMNFDINDDLDTLNQTRVCFRELKPRLGTEIINLGLRNAQIMGQRR